jgi:hypothetical protein
LLALAASAFWVFGLVVVAGLAVFVLSLRLREKKGGRSG